MGENTGIQPKESLKIMDPGLSPTRSFTDKVIDSKNQIYLHFWHGNGSSVGTAQGGHWVAEVSGWTSVASYEAQTLSPKV